MDLGNQVRDLTQWIKNNPLYSLIGALGTILGFIAGVPPAWHAISETFGIPECFRYSDVYYYYDGHFRHLKQAEHDWTEYQQTMKLDFEELHRDRSYILLHNLTPRTDPRWQSMLVRLPVCDGAAQWTYENPEQWTDMYQVIRTVSSAELPKHLQYEADNQPKQYDRTTADVP